MKTTASAAEVDDRRRPASAREASEILRSIRIDHGFLDDEDEAEISKLEGKTHLAVKRFYENGRRALSRFTNSIAEELNSSKLHLISELLQNADDSLYDNNQGEPSITISLFPDKLRIETNETGFTIANVKAICGIGESSKKNSTEDQSIGEKGYGFKSVFGVAYKARIQSGLWSFYFEHHEGDDGLGRITPIETEHDSLPTGVTTRIELLLRDDPNNLFERLSQELTNLHETTIFFLQKIKRLVIHIRPSGGAQKCIEIKRNIVTNQPTVLHYVVSLTRMETIGDCPQTAKTKLYHVREQSVSGMPVDEHRKGSHLSELKLAFPFDPETKCPIIDTDGQHVFAYLPLYRKSHLPFLIQGDFVTTASRESVLDCAWNDHLRASVAEAFCAAIRFFYHDNVLRYQWLKYFPVLLTSGFEAPLPSLIKAQLQKLSVFQTWQSRTPVRLSKLRILPASFTHNHAPLFEDLQEEAYLAPEYSCSDHSILNQIGIPYMTQRELLERFVDDLGRLRSKFRSTPASDPWHETCASVLLSMVSSPTNESLLRIIKGQRIIPLRSPSDEQITSTGIARWAGAMQLLDRPIYFSETYIVKSQNTTATRDSLLIPRGLDLRVVHEESSVGPQRRTLFAILGVTSCAPVTVTSAIFDFHRQSAGSKSGLSAATLVSHLQYLFWCHDAQGPITLPLLVVSSIRLKETNSRLEGLVTRPFYIKTDSPYDAWSLLRDTLGLARDELVTFLSDEYMDAEPTSARSYGRSWLQWLEEVVRLRRRPRLLHHGSGSPRLSSMMLHVLKTHPADFIPTLQAHWAAEYQSDVAHSQAIKKLLSQTEVQCERTSPTALSQTYMPTKVLKAESKRIGLLEYTPFLQLPGLVNDEHHGMWGFLSTFGVGTHAGLDFYLDLLSHAQRLDNSGIMPVGDIVVRIYATIGKLCNWDKAPSVRQRLVEGHGIYDPLSVRGQRWWQPSACLWKSPSCISVKCGLADHYGSDKNISTLFRTYLQIEDVHANDYLDQLRYLKRTALDAKGTHLSHATCAEVYKELHGYQATAELLEHMRQVIEKEKLIFANSTWHSPSECLWSNDTSISDQVSIGGIYTNLKGFFVSKLRVKMLTTAMLVSDLKRKATAKVPLESADAKHLIFKINTMLASEVLDHSLQAKFNELESIRCFPVKGKDGRTTLTDARADFAIIDNERFGRAFGQEADLLDFSLDEVHLLRPFIEATSMTDHYLSHLVKEVSEIEGNPAQSRELTIQLQNLAYALFCCAVHFKSNKIVGRNDLLYNNLLSVQVHEAEKMGTSLVLEQHGRTTRIPSTRTQLKIDTDTSPWKVYVPKDGKTRKACYNSQLPQAMLKLLGISETPATIPVYRLINEPHDHEAETSMLEQFDVLPLSWITRQPAPLRAGSNTPASEPLNSRPFPLLFGTAEGRNSVSGPRQALFASSNNSTLFDFPSSSKASTTANASPFSNKIDSKGSTVFGGSPGFSNPAHTLNFSAAATHIRSASATPAPKFNFVLESSRATPFGAGQASSFGSSTTPDRRSVSASPGPRPGFGSPASTQGDSPLGLDSNLQKEKYRALLENIIRRVSGDDHTWNFNDLTNALPETVRLPLLFDKDETFGVRNEDHLAHDMKIGAAGEVFVFEKLHAAGLPGFTQNSWLSTIRHEAKVHERYKDMPDESPDLPAGSRAEPADIVYADSHGHFAKFLETQDCVGLEGWLSTPPAPKRKYFIEVKTTTQGCDAVFHMSKGQYSRMLEMRKRSFIQAEDVYIVCRVYNLLSNDINMRFYVSPGRDVEAPNAATASGFSFSGNSKPILKFTSKGFEVRPVTTQTPR